MNNTLEKVIELTAVAYRKNKDDISPDTLFSELSTHSILLAGLTSLVEEEFKVTLTIPDVSTSGTPEKLAELIENNLS